jgi:hypothetical protein
MGAGLLGWMRQKQCLGPYDLGAAVLSLRERFGDPDDFEKFLTQVDEVAFGRAPLESGPRGQLANHDRPALFSSIREWFSEIRGESADAYRVFSEQVVEPGDCIVSFNYDNSLERELQLADLWSIGDGYAFPIEGFESDSKVRS